MTTASATLLSSLPRPSTVRRVLLPVLAALCTAMTAAPAASAAAPASAGPAVKVVAHPAGLFRLPLPDGWTAKAELPASGLPFHHLVPEGIAGAGVWITLKPLCGDADPWRADPAAVAAGPVARGAALTMTADGTATGLLGDLPVERFAVAGKGADGGAWRGAAWVCIREDHLVVVHAGAPEAGWEAFRPRAEALLAGFRGADPPVAEPARAVALRDVSDRLMRAAPLIEILDRNGKLIGHGSGIVVHRAGWVVTNRHVVARMRAADGTVVREYHDPVELKFDGRAGRAPIRADVVAVSLRNDLALLRASGTVNWPDAVSVSRGPGAGQGDKVTAVGWPEPEKFGTKSVNTASGEISATVTDERGRPVMHRHTATTSGGNSGGMIFNLDTGRLAAVHAWGFTLRSGGSLRGAVPAEWIHRDFPQIADLDRAEARNRPAAERHALIAWHAAGENHSAAMVEARLAVDADPRDAVASAWLARLYARYGDAGRSDHHLRNAREEGGAASVHAAKAAVIAMVGLGRWKPAMQWATGPEADASTDPEALLAGATALIRGENGDLTRAGRLLDRAEELSARMLPIVHLLRADAVLEELLARGPVTRLPPDVKPDADRMLTVAAAISAFERAEPTATARTALRMALFAGLAGDTSVSTRLLAAWKTGDEDDGSSLRFVKSHQNSPDDVAAAGRILRMLNAIQAAHDLAEHHISNTGPDAPVAFEAGAVQGSEAIRLLRIINGGGNPQQRSETIATLTRQQFHVMAAVRLSTALALQPDARWAPEARRLIAELKVEVDKLAGNPATKTGPGTNPGPKTGDNPVAIGPTPKPLPDPNPARKSDPVTPPQPKPEPKPAPKTDPLPLPLPMPKGDPLPLPMPKLDPPPAKVEPVVPAKVDPLPPRKVDTVVPKTDPLPQPKPDPKPVPKADPKPDPKPVPKAVDPRATQVLAMVSSFDKDAERRDVLRLRLRINIAEGARTDLRVVASVYDDQGRALTTDNKALRSAGGGLAVQKVLPPATPGTPMDVDVDIPTNEVAGFRRIRVDVNVWDPAGRKWLLGGTYQQVVPLWAP